MLGTSVRHSYLNSEPEHIKTKNTLSSLEKILESFVLSFSISFLFLLSFSIF